MEHKGKEPDVWPWPDSLDAVVAAPGSHLAVFESQLTRVLEVAIAAGEREPEHTHRWPSVMVVHRPARIRYYTADILTFTSPEQPSPADQGPRVGWLEPEAPHSVENIDSHAYQAFRIEFKERCTGGSPRIRRSRCHQHPEPILVSLGGLAPAVGLVTLGVSLPN